MPRGYRRNSAANTFDLPPYRTAREANHEKDTCDKQNRFENWISDSYLPDGSSNLSRPTTKNSFRAVVVMNPSP